MSIVGIIANPASGKDIRRLVAHALVMGNREKANIVCRMLLGLDAAGIHDVRIMPDEFGIGIQAIADLGHSKPEVVAGVSILDMDFVGAGIDTIRAVRMLREMGANCIIAIGGDGTTRLVAKESRHIPLLPVSTGTNNVLPQFVEGTVAGLAAGIIAQEDPAGQHALCYRSKRLEIVLDGQPVDHALVDVGVVINTFTGSRAVWETDQILQVAVTRAAPATIGLSTIVGMVQSISIRDPFGAVASICKEESARTVMAPIGPGLFARLKLRQIDMLEPDKCYPITPERPLMLALDGEREIQVKVGQEASICLRMDGPWIVNVDRVLEKAVREQRFILKI
ncbi:MAG TPA: NAD(+)/NADH kinase [Anaerolineaceae bacterium]|nr:NAD(+)/NADH kinase [Anaerolineaceae bacterium]